MRHKLALANNQKERMTMDIKIALAGNPNCGKTTLFNALTGSSQYVGNWPGVTVEKKEGRLKGHKDVVIQDLPGIYSLSPYTLEEVVARSYLVNEKPDAILNIVDGTNIERNLYLTTQLIELGLPVVVAVNMIDLVRKNGDTINLDKLGEALGCEVVEMSALKGEGGMAAAEKAVALAQRKHTGELPHVFTGSVEHALAHIEESIQGRVSEGYLRWYAIKVFERDDHHDHRLHPLRGQDAYYRPLRRRGVRRVRAGCCVCIFYRHRRRGDLRHHAEEIQSLCRGARPLCHGAAHLPRPLHGQRAPGHLGAGLELHQTGGDHHSAKFYRPLVPPGLWL